MTDKTQPISASNPPESKGTRTVQVVEQPLVVEEAKKTLLPEEEKDSKKKKAKKEGVG